MIRRINPRYFIWIGFGLLVLGVVIPLLIILQILVSTFFWNFLAYICQVLGLLLGIAGIAFISVNRRSKKDH